MARCPLRLLAERLTSVGFCQEVDLDRAQVGLGGPQHSQSLRSLFMHIPGLKDVMPNTPDVAKTLLAAVIQDEAPADEFATHNPHIQAVHNPRTMGFGYNYTRGVELARMEYVAMFPGDNEIPGDTIQTILGAVGSADIVVPYVVTPAVRTWSRRFISAAFVGLINRLFGLRLQYFNGPCVHRRRLLMSVPMRTHGFAYMAAILIRLIRSGRSYVEVPMRLQIRQHGQSKAFKPKNVASVLATIASLFWEVRIKDRQKYSSIAQRLEFGP